MSSLAYLRQRKKILEEREKQCLELEQLLGLPVPVWPGWRTYAVITYLMYNGYTVDRLRRSRRDFLRIPNTNKATADKIGQILFGEQGWPK